MSYSSEGMKMIYDTLNQFSGSLHYKNRGQKYTKFTFDVKGKVTVTVKSSDAESNYELALQYAVEKAVKELDQDWLEDFNTETYTEYEDD